MNPVYQRFSHVTIPPVTVTFVINPKKNYNINDQVYTAGDLDKSGFSITYRGTTKITDSKGEAIFQSFKNTSLECITQKDGYETRSLPVVIGNEEEVSMTVDVSLDTYDLNFEVKGSNGQEEGFTVTFLQAVRTTDASGIASFLKVPREPGVVITATITKTDYNEKSESVSIEDLVDSQPGVTPIVQKSEVIYPWSDNLFAGNITNYSAMNKELWYRPNKYKSIGGNIAFIANYTPETLKNFCHAGIHQEKFLNPSNNSGLTTYESYDHPVNNLMWAHAIVYCNLKSYKDGFEPCYSYSTYGSDFMSWPIDYETNAHLITCDWTKNGYRLPTEAEWEFAARGGVKTSGYVYSGGNTLSNVGWTNPAAGGVHHSVAQKTPNELGIYDMSGNVCEFVWDVYAAYPNSPTTDYRGPSSRTSASVIPTRGGTFSHSDTNLCKVNNRGLRHSFTDQYIYMGYRIVRNGEFAGDANRADKLSVFVEGGTFYNGTSDMTVSSFYIGKYAVTQDDWMSIVSSPRIKKNTNYRYRLVFNQTSNVYDSRITIKPIVAYGTASNWGESNMSTIVYSGTPRTFYGATDTIISGEFNISEDIPVSSVIGLSLSDIDNRYMFKLISWELYEKIS